MPEHLPPVPSRRFMVFVPDVVPHFVLVCNESIGWSVRDYSTGQVSLLPAKVLGLPMEQIVGAPKGGGCIAFRAPRVPLSNHSFWKCLTDELGERFLGAPRTTMAAQEAQYYPLLAEPRFQQAAAHWSEFEREQILRSPRSADWTTWNAMQLLKGTRPLGWWNDVAREAAIVNSQNQFAYGVGPPVVEYWQEVRPSEAYDQWLRMQLSQGSRNGRERLRAMDAKPIEAPTRVDLTFEGGGWVVFAESGLRRNWATRTARDPRRNRLVQLADCLMTAARGRPCALWILTQDRPVDREYIELVEQYRSTPEMFAAELPYHPAETLYKLAQRLTVMRWSCVLGSLIQPKPADDPLAARVRKELGRRVHSAAVKSLAIGA